MFMKGLLVVLLLCSSIADARSLNSVTSQVKSRLTVTGGPVGDAILLGVAVVIVGSNVYLSSDQLDRQEQEIVAQTESTDDRYGDLIRQPSISGASIDIADSERFTDGEDLVATDFDGFTIYYEQGSLHTSGTAVALPELGPHILLVKKGGAFNQLIHTDQIVGVAIDDSSHLGLPVAVPTEESEYEWQPVPYETTADLEAIIQQGHLIHGDVLQQFTGGQLLIASSYTIDKNGVVTPLENPRNIFAPASKVTWFDPEAAIPTATKCEQCHDAEFPNED